MKKQECVVMAGSNCDAGESISCAFEALSRVFSDFVAGEAVRTPAVGEGYHGEFVNRAASFTSSRTASEVKGVLKNLEYEAGRRPGDKQRGVMPLDLDLLIFDGRVLKPSDMERDYVVSLLKALKAMPEDKKQACRF